MPSVVQIGEKLVGMGQPIFKYIHTVESSLGDGVKRVYPDEKTAMERLRRKIH